MSKTPRWLRIAGRHAPAATVLRKAAPWLEARGISVQLPPESSPYDYAQVDPMLETLDDTAEPPAAILGYAGFSPQQRGVYLQWAQKPAEPAMSTSVQQIPPAFRTLYCANLEVALIESAAAEKHAVVESLINLLATLGASSHWSGDLQLSRLFVLVARLTDKIDMINLASIAPALIGVALGTMAQSPAPRLSAPDALYLAEAWKITQSPPSATLTSLRLDEFAAATEGDLLLRALRTLPETSFAPKPFRTAHRDLRLAFPQADLRPTLEPLLAEVLSPVALVEDETDNAPHSHQDESSPTPSPLPQESEPRANKAKGQLSDKDKNKEWSLVLEFSESRSPYATFALDLAQKQPGYTTLLDEDRTIVHRVVFRKSEMRRFWRLWEYVQGWNSAHVYLNGDELQKWQIWPWSQALR